jgi:hypothetical protein
MTPTAIMTGEDFRGLGAPDLVYVREIRAADVMDEVAATTTRGLSIDPEAILYAVHGADGERWSPSQFTEGQRFVSSRRAQRIHDEHDGIELRSGS